MCVYIASLTKLVDWCLSPMTFSCSSCIKPFYKAKDTLFAHVIILNKVGFYFTSFQYCKEISETARIIYGTNLSFQTCALSALLLFPYLILGRNKIIFAITTMLVKLYFRVWISRTAAKSNCREGFMQNVVEKNILVLQ